MDGLPYTHATSSAVIPNRTFTAALDSPKVRPHRRHLRQLSACFFLLGLSAFGQTTGLVGVKRRGEEEEAAPARR